MPVLYCEGPALICLGYALECLFVRAERFLSVSGEEEEESWSPSGMELLLSLMSLCAVSMAYLCFVFEKEHRMTRGQVVCRLEALQTKSCLLLSCEVSSVHICFVCVEVCLRVLQKAEAEEAGDHEDQGVGRPLEGNGPRECWTHHEEDLQNPELVWGGKGFLCLRRLEEMGM